MGTVQSLVLVSFNSDAAVVTKFRFSYFRSSNSSCFSSTIGGHVSVKMHSFYIYEEVVARDPGWIPGFSHFLTPPQGRSIFVWGS